MNNSNAMLNIVLNLTPQEQIDIWHWINDNISKSWSWVGTREIEQISPPLAKEKIIFSFESKDDFLLFYLTHSDYK